MLVCTYSTAGEGVNLHKCCSNMLLIDVANNVNLVLQAIGRLHRLGAKSIQEVMVVVMRDSYDCALEGRQTRKMIQQLAAEGYIPVEQASTAEDIETAASLLLVHLLGQDTSRLSWDATNRGNPDADDIDDIDDIDALEADGADTGALDPGNRNMKLALRDLPELRLRGEFRP